MSVSETISRHFSSLEDLAAILTGGKTRAELREEGFAKGYEQTTKLNREQRKKMDAADPYRHRDLADELDTLERRVANTKEYLEGLEANRDTLTSVVKEATRLIEQLESTKHRNKVEHAGWLRRVKLQPAEKQLAFVERRLPGMKKLLKRQEEDLKEWKQENSAALKAQREEKALSYEVHNSNALRF